MTFLFIEIHFNILQFTLMRIWVIIRGKLSGKWQNLLFFCPSVCSSLCLSVVLLKSRILNLVIQKNKNKNKIKCAQVYGYQDFKIQVCVLSFMRHAVMKITRLSLWIRMPSLGMWLVRLFFFPFSLIKSTYCARSSVLCNILHACNLSTSENFQICHAVMCVIFLIFWFVFKNTRAFSGVSVSNPIGLCTSTQFWSI